MARNNDGRARIFVCNCEQTMPLDLDALQAGFTEDQLSLGHTQLCRSQIEAFAAGCAETDRVLVACTQEHQTFAEALLEAGLEADLKTVNIRERAGWSDDAANAMPKIVALLKDASSDLPTTQTVEMVSNGICLVYGRPDVALDAARQLESRLNVSVLMTETSDALPLANMDLMLATGRIDGARGHLGNFEINVGRYAAVRPSSRGNFSFDLARDGAASTCDLILDVSGGAPLFPSHERRDGYVRADPTDPARVQKAIFEIADLVGTFEKPRYIDFKADLCAHARSRITGCTRCLDVCPASAIQPDGDAVAIDPYLCGGCGACNSVCPTGAATYAYPRPEHLLSRIRDMLMAFDAAGGEDPVLLLHDERHGRDTIEAMARFGRGLPARVLPMAVNETTQIGADVLLSSLAYGARRVAVLVPSSKTDELAGLAGQIAMVETIATAIGYDSGLAFALVEDDPDRVQEALYDLPATETSPAASRFAPQPEKRTNLRLAAQHLRSEAPAPVDTVPLPPGAPFGTVEVDVDGCTLCFACVSACPTGALSDNPDTPQLGFQESACIQCGLCRNTCPEKVIGLTPRFDFRDAAADRRIVKEEEPFECVTCGKPFATKSTINKMLEQLSDKHWMFQGGAAERLKMCEDCRVVEQFNDKDRPYKYGERPRPRTTDDYLTGDAETDPDD